MVTDGVSLGNQLGHVSAIGELEGFGLSFLVVLAGAGNVEEGLAAGNLVVLVNAQGNLAVNDALHAVCLAIHGRHLNGIAECVDRVGHEGHANGVATIKAAYLAGLLKQETGVAVDISCRPSHNEATVTLYVQVVVLIGSAFDVVRGAHELATTHSAVLPHRGLNIQGHGAGAVRSQVQAGSLVLDVVGAVVSLDEAEHGTVLQTLTCIISRIHQIHSVAHNDGLGIKRGEVTVGVVVDNRVAGTGNALNEVLTHSDSLAEELGIDINLIVTLCSAANSAVGAQVILLIELLGGEVEGVPLVGADTVGGTEHSLSGILDSLDLGAAVLERVVTSLVVCLGGRDYGVVSGRGIVSPLTGLVTDNNQACGILVIGDGVAQGVGVHETGVEGFGSCSQSVVVLLGNSAGRIGLGSVESSLHVREDITHSLSLAGGVLYNGSGEELEVGSVPVGSEAGSTVRSIETQVLLATGGNHSGGIALALSGEGSTDNALEGPSRLVKFGIVRRINVELNGVVVYDLTTTEYKCHVLNGSGINQLHLHVVTGSDAVQAGVRPGAVPDGVLVAIKQVAEEAVLGCRGFSVGRAELSGVGNQGIARNCRAVVESDGQLGTNLGQDGLGLVLEVHLLLIFCIGSNHGLNLILRYGEQSPLRIDTAIALLIAPSNDVAFLIGAVAVASGMERSALVGTVHSEVDAIESGVGAGLVIAIPRALDLGELNGALLQCVEGSATILGVEGGLGLHVLHSVLLVGATFGLGHMPHVEDLACILGHHTPLQVGACAILAGEQVSVGEHTGGLLAALNSHVLIELLVGGDEVVTGSDVRTAADVRVVQGVVKGNDLLTHLSNLLKSILIVVHHVEDALNIQVSLVPGSVVIGAGSAVGAGHTIKGLHLVVVLVNESAELLVGSLLGGVLYELNGIDAPDVVVGIVRARTFGGVFMIVVVGGFAGCPCYHIGHVVSVIGLGIHLVAIAFRSGSKVDGKKTGLGSLVCYINKEVGSSVHVAQQKLSSIFLR